MQEAEESQDEEDDCRKHEVDDGVGEPCKIKLALKLLDGVLAPTLTENQGCIIR